MTHDVNDLVQVKYGHLLEAYAFSEVHGLDNDLLGMWSKSLYEYLEKNFPNIENDTNIYLRDEDGNGNGVTRLYETLLDEKHENNQHFKKGNDKLNFSLSYRGPLKANGNKEHKHALRKHFSGQIQKIWEFEIGRLCDMQAETIKESPKGVKHQIGDYVFIPIVSPTYDLTVEIDITILKDMELGSVISSSGDIDNSLKTLFDAFQKPDVNQMNGIVPPASNKEKEIYCLVENDSLIKRVSAKAARFLEDGHGQSDVLMVADVTIIRNEKIFDNMQHEKLW